MQNQSSDHMRSRTQHHSLTLCCSCSNSFFTHSSFCHSSFSPLKESGESYIFLQYLPCTNPESTKVLALRSHLFLVDCWHWDRKKMYNLHTAREALAVASYGIHLSNPLSSLARPPSCSKRCSAITEHPL